MIEIFFPDSKVVRMCTKQVSNKKCDMWEDGGIEAQGPCLRRIGGWD
jgi:hypothetical protein